MAYAGMGGVPLGHESEPTFLGIQSTVRECGPYGNGMHNLPYQ